MEELVTVAMALYKPNVPWLIEQLKSLNKQTYENIELCIWNDYPEDEADYAKVLDRYISRFPYSINKGKDNLGAVGAFEKLTTLANGKYIAYCDQDDIWLPDKIEKSVAIIKNSKKQLLACTKVSIIDADGDIEVQEAVLVEAKRYLDNQDRFFEYVLAHNPFLGCTMLVEKQFAVDILPFPKITNEYHDWWLMVCAVAADNYVICDDVLMKYRVHGNNISSFLNGIDSTEKYYEQRILPFKLKFEVAERRLEYLSIQRQKFIKYNLEYSKARTDYYSKSGFRNLCRLLNYRKVNNKAVIFEIVLQFIPEFLFKYIIMGVKLIK